MVPLSALLAKAGCPWLHELLAEAAGGEEAAVAAIAAGGCEALLLAADLETRYATALMDAHSTLCQALVAAPAEGGERPASFTRGGLYDVAFLEAVAPLYAQVMGAENLGPLLHSLVRFAKPNQVLELGGGFTSLFLLQALADNAAELAAAAQAAAQAAALGVPWLTPSAGAQAESAAAARLHCVDNLAHEHSTAGRVRDAATALGLESHLLFHDADALDADLPARLAPGTRHFDLLWVDLGAGARLGALVDAWWPRVNPCGGLLCVHSTLTNAAGRAWLAGMREGCASGADARYGRFELLSLLEPHKRFQNSITLLRRKGGGPGGEPLWDEPVYSTWP